MIVYMIVSSDKVMIKSNECIIIKCIYLSKLFIIKLNLYILDIYYISIQKISIIQPFKTIQ